MDKGGYRNIRGGGIRTDIARKDGNIEWYLNDRHFFPADTDVHPDLLALKYGSLFMLGVIILPILIFL